MVHPDPGTIEAPAPAADATGVRQALFDTGGATSTQINPAQSVVLVLALASEADGPGRLRPAMARVRIPTGAAPTAAHHHEAGATALVDPDARPVVAPGTARNAARAGQLLFDSRRSARAHVKRAESVALVIALAGEADRRIAPVRSRPVRVAPLPITRAATHHELGTAAMVHPDPGTIEAPAASDARSLHSTDAGPGAPCPADRYPRGTVDNAGPGSRRSA